MLFPDCRHDNYYNQDFLDETNKKIVRGFDYAAETADNFFDNIDVLGSDYIEKFFNEKLPDDMKDRYHMEIMTPEPRTETREVKTYGDYIRLCLIEWIERERDALITSMIDDMDDELYNTIRNKVLEENPEKGYYDTRKFMITGEK